MSGFNHKLREVIQTSQKDFIKAKNRKTIHYSLLGALLLIQIFLGITIYNEWINQNKLNALKADKEKALVLRTMSDQTRNDYLDAQWQLQTYFIKREAAALDKYFDLMGKVITQMDTLREITFEHNRWQKLMQVKQKKEKEIIGLKEALDSLITQYSADSKFFSDQQLSFKAYPEQEVLQDIEVETRIISDSTTRKNLFSRLMAAFSGKVEIQKEIVENTVKMKYGRKTTSGSVQEQMKQLLQQAEAYYRNQFSQLQNSYFGLRSEDTALLGLNEALVKESNEMMEKYNTISTKIYNESHREEAAQQRTNQTIRIVSLMSLIIGLMLLTVFLILVTRLAFEKEKQLVYAQREVQQHLVFKSKIIGMLSHEVRSPLSLIAIYTKRLNQRFTDSETKEVFHSLNYTTNSLLMMVNQVLDFSKAEQQQLQLNKSAFNLNDALKTLLITLQNLTNEKGNQFLCTSNLPENVMVSADLVKIQQLFFNLVGNANRFTTAGTIHATITLMAQGKKHFRLLVEIKDNGKGIPTQDLNIITEAIVQGRETVRLNEISTGLGLLLCKEIINLYKGNFSIASQEDKGTVVAFSLTLDKKNE
ncbi:HAMP domain-containing histidine kinase [Flavobacterium piscinae]|uniref:histidine kinase n=1 Tax=Flavobacterium piscinae TaxID=2506424 RepID=A0A4Q1KPK9_9FLAO|nr:HAMP domain-containing sensor histidine kinase [Flavobacterium piscinae]RXR31515.1 HAMP domain-containing histidine kinase [Flavobacterium piscinae]